MRLPNHEGGSTGTQRKQKITWRSTTLLHRQFEGEARDGTQRAVCTAKERKRWRGKSGGASVLWLIISDECLVLEFDQRIRIFIKHLLTPFATASSCLTNAILKIQPNLCWRGCRKAFEFREQVN